MVKINFHCEVNQFNLIVFEICKMNAICEIRKLNCAKIRVALLFYSLGIMSSTENVMIFSLFVDVLTFFYIIIDWPFNTCITIEI